MCTKCPYKFSPCTIPPPVRYLFLVTHMPAWITSVVTPHGRVLLVLAREIPYTVVGCPVSPIFRHARCHAQPLCASRKGVCYQRQTSTASQGPGPSCLPCRGGFPPRRRRKQSQSEAAWRVDVWQQASTVLWMDPKSRRTLSNPPKKKEKYSWLRPISPRQALDQAVRPDAVRENFNGKTNDYCHCTG